MALAAKPLICPITVNAHSKPVAIIWVSPTSMRAPLDARPLARSMDEFTTEKLFSGMEIAMRAMLPYSCVVRAPLSPKMATADNNTMAARVDPQIARIQRDDITAGLAFAVNFACFNAYISEPRRPHIAAIVITVNQVKNWPADEMSVSLPTTTVKMMFANRPMLRKITGQMFLMLALACRINKPCLVYPSRD